MITLLKDNAVALHRSPWQRTSLHFLLLTFPLSTLRAPSKPEVFGHGGKEQGSGGEPEAGQFGDCRAAGGERGTWVWLAQLLWTCPAVHVGVWTEIGAEHAPGSAVSGHSSAGLIWGAN